MIHKEIETKPGTEEWKNFTIQCFDYISNPAILKKNDMIPYRLVHNYIPLLINDEDLFKEIIEKLNQLKMESYGIKRAVGLNF